MTAPPTPDTLLRLTDTLWVKRSQAMAYNCGAFIGAGRAALIDPGLRPEGVATLLDLLAEQGAALERIIITHSHWDHILGPELLPPAPITAHAAYRHTLEQSSAGTLRAIARWEGHFGVERAAPFRPPMPDEAVGDGHTIAIGGLSLRLIHIPGHAADQVAIYEPQSAALWAADTLSDLEIPFVSDSLATYEATLARLAGLEIRALAPGHGAPTNDPAEIAARIAADRAYLAELRERVQAAVDSGDGVDAALAACAAMTFKHPEANARPHKLNVESVYIELGGAADPDSVGWAQKWLVDE
jgi:glyoxylase-like metal-dependent hydrolase (beta-lactamase superfamily II)